MSFDEQHIKQINDAFGQKPKDTNDTQGALHAQDEQDAMLRAQPNGAGLRLLSEALLVAYPTRKEAIKQLSVRFSFDPTRNPPSRSGATISGQPVRGSLVIDVKEGDKAIYSEDEVTDLNVDPGIIGALCFPEVFPSRLESVRQQWIACADRYVSRAKIDVGPEDIEAASLKVGLLVPLGRIIGGAGDKNCPGSDCPPKVKGM